MFRKVWLMCLITLLMIPIVHSSIITEDSTPSETNLSHSGITLNPGACATKLWDDDYSTYCSVADDEETAIYYFNYTFESGSLSSSKIQIKDNDNTANYSFDTPCHTYGQNNGKILFKIHLYHENPDASSWQLWCYRDTEGWDQAGPSDEGVDFDRIYETSMFWNITPQTHVPSWYDNSSTLNSTTTRNDYADFNINFTGPSDFQFVKFSINDTGSWINTTYPVDSGTYTLNHTEQISALSYTYVSWKFFGGNTTAHNESDTWTFRVANDSNEKFKDYFIYGGSDLLSSISANVSNDTKTWSVNPVNVNLYNYSEGDIIDLCVTDLNDAYGSKCFKDTIVFLESSENFYMTSLNMTLRFSEKTSGIGIDRDGIKTVFTDVNTLNLSFTTFRTGADELVSIYFSNRTFFSNTSIANGSNVTNIYSDFYQVYQFYNDQTSSVNDTLTIFDSLDQYMYFKVLASDNSPIPDAKVKVSFLNMSYDSGTNYSLADVIYTDRNGDFSVWTNSNDFMKLEIYHEDYGTVYRTKKLLPTMGLETNPLTFIIISTLTTGSHAISHTFPKYVRSFLADIIGYFQVYRGQVVKYNTDFGVLNGVFNKTAEDGGYDILGNQLSDGTHEIILYKDTHFNSSGYDVEIYFYVDDVNVHNHTMYLINETSTVEDILDFSAQGFDSDLLNPIVIVVIIALVLISQFAMGTGSNTVGFHTFMGLSIFSPVISGSFWPLSAICASYYLMNRIKKFTGVTP